ncbi:MAG: chemotaxis protein CheC [Clostridia bacterium]|nr:chemotaxis protein CheC [Clostridia bacterium]
MAFNDVGMDVLKEIANIGASKASTALSEMINRQITMKVPNCNLVKFSHICDRFGGADKIIGAVLVQMSGDMEGFVMLVGTLKDLCKMTSLAMGQEVTVSEDADPDLMLQTIMPVEELANIMISCYLGAISDMTGFKVIPSVPSLTVDIAQAIMNVPALMYGDVGDVALMMDNEFNIPDMGGQFLLIPTVESYQNLLKALGIEA